VSEAESASPVSGDSAEEKAPDEGAGSSAELTATKARLEEVTRAYSAMFNDQKDFRSRLEREKDRVLEAERGKIALHLLQVGDELERALSVAQDDQGPLGKGVRLIHEGLGKTLASLGLERFVVVGQPFDANLAEAVDLVAVSEEALDGHVVAEVTPGFRLGGKVLRAARVRVGRYSAPA